MTNDPFENKEDAEAQAAIAVRAKLIGDLEAAGQSTEASQTVADIYSQYLYVASKQFGTTVDELHNMSVQSAGGYDAANPEDYLGKARYMEPGTGSPGGTDLKQRQFEIIQRTNPMTDDYHTGIRSAEEIKSLEETLDDPESFSYPDFTLEQAKTAVAENKITVYSSKPIAEGVFVSPSRQAAQDYAGPNGKVYSAKVSPREVAWINGDEGMYADVEINPEGITQSDIDIIHNNITPGKSINDFTDADIQATEAWARKFFRELGVKSPFFRAWFGDWRAYDTDKVKVVKLDRTFTDRNDLKANGAVKDETVICKDLKDAPVEIEHEIIKETLANSRAHRKQNAFILSVLDKIKPIVENAILLDTKTPKHAGNKPHVSFLHELYSVVEDINGNRHVICLFVEEDQKITGNITKKAYSLKEIKFKDEALTTDQGTVSRTESQTASSVDTVADLFDFVKQNNRKFNPKPCSLVLDSKGKPLMFYHGTLNKFEAFAKEMIGERYQADEQGFYFISSEGLAKDYASSEFDANRKGYVMPVYLNAKNPLTVNAEWAAKNGMRNVFKEEDAISLWDNEEYQEAIKQAAQEMNADGIIIDDGNNKMAIVFEPNQIKSVENVGTFNPASSNIFFQSVKHASPAVFEAFDHSFMGTGEGQQVYGWGTYAAMNQKVIDWYLRQFNKDRYKYKFSFNGEGIDYANLSRIQDATLHDMSVYVAAFYNKLTQKVPKQLPSDNSLRKQFEDFVDKDIRASEELLSEAKEKAHEKDIADYQQYLKTVKRVKEWYNSNRDRFVFSAEELTTGAHQYEVEIPDVVQGENYLDWDNKVSRSQLLRIFEGLKTGGQAKESISQLEHDIEATLDVIADKELQVYDPSTPSDVVTQLEADIERLHEDVDGYRARIEELKNGAAAKDIASRRYFTLNGNVVDIAELSAPEDLLKFFSESDRAELLKDNNILLMLLQEWSFNCNRNPAEAVHVSPQMVVDDCIRQLQQIVGTRLGNISATQDELANVTDENVARAYRSDIKGWEADVKSAEKDLKVLEIVKNAFGEVEMSADDFADMYGDSTGRDVYFYLQDMLGSPKAASQFLDSVGIVGNMYLDGVSRKHGNGTYNFVIFNERNAQIVQRLFQEGKDAVRGSMAVNRTTGSKLVELFSAADTSTFVHEMGHVILEDLMRYGQLEGATDTAKANLRTVLEYLGISDLDISDLDHLSDEDSDRLRAAHERWAEAFGVYIAEGVAPSSGMRAVFKQVRRWLIDLFMEAERSGVELSPEVRGVFDSLLATPQEMDDFYEANTSLEELLKETDAINGRVQSVKDGSAEARPWELWGVEEQTDDPAVIANIEKGREAIKKCLETHEEIKGAMYRDEIGDIDIVYGEEGTEKRKYEDGYGLAKILKKHGQTAIDQIAEVIAKGKYEAAKADRCYFLYNGYKAVIRLTWNGDKKTWLVTNFQDTKKAVRGTEDFSRSVPTAAETSSDRGAANIDIVAKTEGNVNAAAGTHSLNDEVSRRIRRVNEINRRLGEVEEELRIEFLC